MPLVGPLLGQEIFNQFNSSGFTGPQSLNCAMAIGNGIINSILSTNSYSGTTTGLGPGPGIGTGKINGLIGPIVGQNILSFMSSVGFTGPQSPNTAMAIGNAFAFYLLSNAIVTSSGAPVALGVGSGPILGIIGSVIGQSIFASFSSVGFTGPQSPNFANAIGNGIALSMASAIVTTNIVGTPAPPPAGPITVAGVEAGKMF